MRVSHHSDPRDRYVHHTPGRLRVRSGLVRHNPNRAAEAVAFLRSLPGIRSAVANDLTGSLTVRYDPASTTGQTILADMRQAGWIGVDSAIPTHQTIPPPAWLNSDVGSQLARQVALCALEKLAEHSVAALIGAIL